MRQRLGPGLPTAEAPAVAALGRLAISAQSIGALWTHAQWEYLVRAEKGGVSSEDAPRIPDWRLPPSHHFAAGNARTRVRHRGPQ